jgi:hypothetical protein
MTHSQVAASVRRDKEAHPERYCHNKHCLWNVTRNPCGKHPLPQGATQPQAMESDLDQVTR